VQGTDYAYTIQGWLKGVNSSAISGNSGTEYAPNTGLDILDVNNRNQYGVPLLYLARTEINFIGSFESGTTNPNDQFEAYLDPSLPNCSPTGSSAMPYVNGDMGRDGDPHQHYYS